MARPDNPDLRYLGSRQELDPTYAIAAMLRSGHKIPDDAAALDRVKAWTRERFKLANHAAVLVAEIACGLPGCPPLETVVAFWSEGDTRHQFKVFKPVADIVAEDLPPAWLKSALAAVDGIDCDCC